MSIDYPQHYGEGSIPPQGLLEESSTPQVAPGSTWSHNGNLYIYVQGSEAFSKGDIVRLERSILTSEGELTADANTDGSVIKDADHGITSGSLDGKGYMALVADGSGIGQSAIVLRNDDTYFYLDRELSTPVTNTSQYIIFRYGRVKKAGAEDNVSGGFVRGVCVVDLTDEYFGWIQRQGLCPYIHVDAVDANGQENITAGGLVAPTGASGQSGCLTGYVGGEATCSTNDGAWGTSLVACDEDGYISVELW